MDSNKRSLGVQQPESPVGSEPAPPLVTRVTASAFGRCVLEREFADHDPVSIGEASEATIVVPGEFGAHSLLVGGELNPGPFAGEVVGTGGRQVVEAYADPFVLELGDQATLRLVDYPHVQVVLRREPPLEVLLRAPIGLRDLFPVLTYGLTAAMLLAAIATSVVLVSEIPEIEASTDIAQAMYNLDPRTEPPIVSFEPVREVTSQDPEFAQEPEPVVLAGERGVLAAVAPEDASVGLLMGEVEPVPVRNEAQHPPEPEEFANVEIEPEPRAEIDAEALVFGPNGIPDDPGMGTVAAGYSFASPDNEPEFVLGDKDSQVADVIGNEVVDLADSEPPLLLAITGKSSEDLPLGLDRTEVAVVVEQVSDPNPAPRKTSSQQPNSDVTQELCIHLLEPRRPHRHRLSATILHSTPSPRSMLSLSSMSQQP